jgi:hypothetical protein
MSDFIIILFSWAKKIRSVPNLALLHHEEQKAMPPRTQPPPAQRTKSVNPELPSLPPYRNNKIKFPHTIIKFRDLHY